MRPLVSSRVLSLALGGLFLTIGCDFGGGSKNPDEAPPGTYGANADQQKIIRDAEKQAAESYKGQLDQPEAEAKKALEMMAGTASVAAGAPPPPKASETIAKLQKHKVEIRVEPVLDANGNPIPSGLMEMRDSYTDMIRAMGNRKPTKKETKKIQKGAAYAGSLNDLRMQVMAAAMPSMASGWLVASQTLTTMLRTSSMVRSRREQEMEWIDEDYELVRQALVDQRRAETIAAINQSTMAAYQAAFAGADPSFLDEYAAESLKAFPIEPEVTLEEAKAYVDNLAENVEAAQEVYEAEMRKTYGDAVYEAQYKAQLDGLFARAAGASSAKGATQIANEANAQYKADVIKCFKGEPIDPGSLAGGPTCDDYARCGRGEAPNGPAVTPEKCAEAASWVAESGGLAEAGANAAVNMAKGELAKLLPADGPVNQALTGVRALRNRDFMGAADAALKFVPNGPAKAGIQMVVNFFKKIGEIRKKVKG